ncbi:hypothetical protein PR202_gb00084 [Eleusine coracana subsp. coracana]|uniref:Uncharacterized protein n=1 Tax=Eleusine coracana subsp. coracana TaxID=191504 RepID=A0AAV5DU06_ELECO|nr:hypothetical protein PR202_gb00084 [Eleusine coracana subsp. coracana]
MANSTLESDAPKTPIEIIAEILPKTTFHRNAGLESKGRSTTAATAATARVEELEDELDADRQAGLDLRDKGRALDEASGGLGSGMIETSGGSRNGKAETSGGC